MKTLTCTLLLFFSLTSFARDHLIYSVAHELPMGFENEELRKNFYMNLGSGQGVKEGTVLDVYRTVSVDNPYENQRRVNYKVKIGELKVIHVDENASIAIHEKILRDAKTPLFEIPDFMIGDRVSININ
jgi:hypothetical protein